MISGIIKIEVSVIIRDQDILFYHALHMLPIN